MEWADRFAATWQYNGVARWYEIIEWCNEHIGTRFSTHQYETIYFVREEDYTMFMLRWA